MHCFDDLPIEVLIRLSRYCNESSRIAMRATCKTLRDAVLGSALQLNVVKAMHVDRDGHPTAPLASLAKATSLRCINMSCIDVSDSAVMSALLALPRLNSLACMFSTRSSVRSKDIVSSLASLTALTSLYVNSRQMRLGTDTFAE
jgi:hypothetical protein